MTTKHTTIRLSFITKADLDFLRTEQWTKMSYEEIIKKMMNYVTQEKVFSDFQNYRI